MCSCSSLELIQSTMLLITRGINRNKKGITVWHRHNHVFLEQLLCSSFNLSGLEAHHNRVEAEEPPFIKQEEIMMTELLTTSNTTACTTTAPCLDTDPHWRTRNTWWTTGKVCWRTQ